MRPAVEHHSVTRPEFEPGRPDVRPLTQPWWWNTQPQAIGMIDQCGKLREYPEVKRCPVETSRRNRTIVVKVYM